MSCRVVSCIDREKLEGASDWTVLCREECPDVRADPCCRFPSLFTIVSKQSGRNVLVMEELPMHRLKGYAEVKIVGMRHHYKSSDGQRLPNPLPGCPVSLQLEPSNPYHQNAIKVINEIDTRHLGYIVREIADALTPLLKDNAFASARGILSTPRHNYCSLEVISCQVLLFFAVPLELVPPLPPQLGFHEDLSSPSFMLASTPVAFTGCTLHDYDSYNAHCMAPLHLQPRDKQPLLQPCSTNADSPIHVRDGDATAPQEPPPQFQGQIQAQTLAGTQSEVQDTAQRNKVTCMKCKQKGGGPFFQCSWSGCPLLIHESCMGDVIGDYCHFCLYLIHRKEYHQSRKDSSSCTAACREEYKKARDIAIRFLGGNTFMRLRELTVLDPLPPPQVQLPHNMDTPTDEAAIFDHSRGFDGTVESRNSVRVADQIKKGSDLPPPIKAQTQVLAAEMNEVVCMKCKQTGRGLFFQCAQSGCPLLIHESCIIGVVGRMCLFCLFLACRGERLGAKKGSDLYRALKAKYEEARKSAIRFFGKETFMRLRELAGLDPLLPTQVQVPCNANMQGYTEEGREEEAVGTSTIIEKSASKEKKEKVKDAANSRGFDGTVESQNSVRVANQTKKGTDPLPPTKAQTQVRAAEMNEVVCMKCKQMGRGLFFKCAQSGCPLLIHESCIVGVVSGTCLFCLFLARRGERLRAKKGSDLYGALKAKYEEARKSAIHFFGKETFMRLRELAGLDPLLPTQVQVPCNTNMQGYTGEGRDEEAVGTSTVIEKSASKQKKEKVKDAANSAREKNLEEKEVAGRGKRRLPPRPSLNRACKRRIQASSPPWHSVLRSVN